MRYVTRCRVAAHRDIPIHVAVRELGKCKCVAHDGTSAVEEGVFEVINFKSARRPHEEERVVRQEGKIVDSG